MLEHCLAALAAQVRPADEIIVVDNGSTDDSAEVARRFGATVVPEPRAGIWAAAARGFDEADGDILARCDADSRPGETWLQRIESLLLANPDAVAISGPGRFYDLVAPLRVIADVLYMRAYFAGARLWLGNRTVFGSNFAMPASTWEALGDEVHRDDPEVHDDIDLAYHFHPADTVLYSTALDVGISARPLGDFRGMVLRTRRGLHTAAVHGSAAWPTVRWAKRARAIRGRRAMWRTGRVPLEQEVP